ncbi:hypothetical protein [Natronomonas sp. EA1]|uniref:hypothetical protein n=1 Tax=Natronomonas sp. EA1 TaxID=3421655 RepID=UPI003EC0887E
MSASNTRTPSNADVPHFDLVCALDDTDSPTEVTVFARDSLETLATEWITIDVDHAVPVDEIR